MDDAFAEQLRTVWQQVDVDGNGTLDQDELKTVLLRMGYAEEELDIAQMMEELDEDKSGDVDYEEFTAWFTQQGEEAQGKLFVVYYRTQDGAQEETTVGELPTLMASGAVDEDTIIWADGLAEWTSLGVARQQTGLEVAAALEAELLDAGDDTKRGLLAMVWKRVDKDGNGSLDEDEVGDVLKQMGRPSSEAATVMAEMLVGAGGEIGIDEFESWYFAQSSVAMQALILVYYEGADGEQKETTANELPALISAGYISAGSRVWVDGMEDWKPLSEAISEMAALLGDAATLGDVAAQTLKATLAASTASDAEKAEEVQMLEAGLELAAKTSARLREVEAEKAALQEELSTSRDEVEMLESGMSKLAQKLGNRIVENEALKGEAKAAKRAVEKVRDEDKLKQRMIKSADDVEALFRVIDADGSGTIDLGEFTLACLLSISDRQLLETTFRQIDTDGSGEIELDEFRTGFGEPLFGVPVCLPKFFLCSADSDSPYSMRAAAYLQQQIAYSRGVEDSLRAEAAALEEAGEQLEVELASVRQWATAPPPCHGDEWLQCCIRLTGCCMHRSNIQKTSCGNSQLRLKTPVSSWSRS